MQSNDEVLAALGTLSPRDRRLAGRTVLVTHATDPVGEAIARVLAAAGARVAVHAKDPIRANAVSGAIMAAGGQAHVVPGDLASPPAFVRAFVGQARAPGPAEQWRTDYGSRGVRINTVLPGPPPVRPVDIAYAVRFLVSDEAAMLAGITLPVGSAPTPAWLGT